MSKMKRPHRPGVQPGQLGNDAQKTMANNNEGSAPASLLAEAEKLFGQGHIDEAEALFSDIIRHYPHLFDAWNGYGVVQYSQQKYQEALRSFQSGLQIAPDDQSLICNCIQVLVELERYTDASRSIEQYLEAGGNRVVASKLARAVSQQKDSLLSSDPFKEIHVNDLHRAFHFETPLEYPPDLLSTPLDRWKMEINDAPIFRYLYRQFQPKRHLEFGTWQGAGTVYCLEESGATVWTINLPFGEDKPEGGSQYAGDGDSFGLGTAMAADWARRIGLPEQSGYRTDCFGFIGRFYLEKGLGNRVCQIYADSTEWDDSAYPDGFFDSILVDGGHTPDIVASDTKKALRLLRPGGLMLWHDFCPPVAERFPVTRGVIGGLTPMWPLLQEHFAPLAWIKPSWILAGVKRGGMP